jgi:hypothetical protein
VNQLQQELDLKEEFQRKQVSDVHQKLQDSILEKEQLTMEITALSERTKHDIEMARERAHIDATKQKSQWERQAAMGSEHAREVSGQNEQLRDRNEKLQYQLQEHQVTQKRELE